jgi:Protein kinase domain
MVMRFERGHSFEAWLNGLGRLPTQEELDSIVAPLLDALQMMHAENFLHRDIAPDNIIVRADGSPVLLDFGAARRAVAEMSRTMTGIVKAGYSPHEQYSSDSRLQGPWSDLYALGGTLYRAVTGHAPEEATLRVDEDHMPPASQVARKSGYRPGFLSAIDTCLRVRHSERPRSVAQLRPWMLGRTSQPRPGLRFVEAFKLSGNVTAQRVPVKPTSRDEPPSPTPRTPPPSAQTVVSRRWRVVAAAFVALLGGTYGGYEYSRWQPMDAAEVQPQAQERTRQEEAKRTAEAEKKAAEERARQEEAERVAEAEKKAAEERARQEEAKRVAEAEKKAAEERARQEAKRIAETTAVLSPPANKPTINAPDKPRGAFDGNWQIQWYDAGGCSDPHASFSLTIANDAISSGGERPATGSVDKAGNITFSRPALIVKGATQRYVGRLSGNSGSGRFVAARHCAGRFAATRR